MAGFEFEVEVPRVVAFDHEALTRHLWERFEAKLKAAGGLELVLNRRYIDARPRVPAVKVRGSFVPVQDIAHGLTWSKTLFRKDVSKAKPVVVVGYGPAGMFAALRLIEAGYRPIVLERGKDVRTRRRDLAAIIKDSIVNPDSNYCFGEGGAGTYSDGKLYTRSVKRGNVRRILELLVTHGATTDILIDAHPHIGTNKLPKVVSDISQTILDAGGEIHFGTRVTKLLISNNELTGVETETCPAFDCSSVILATGHSARDIFRMLRDADIQIEAKPFALGVRVEHQQSFIDKNQYRLTDREGLPAASYALKTQARLSDSLTKPVYSFCMCPGGFIVPAATMGDEIVVNGMSPSRRDSEFSNSGIVVGIDEEDWQDFKTEGPLAAMTYQAMVEKSAFDKTDQTQVAPAQLLSDFIKDRQSTELNETSYQPGLKPKRFSEILPPKIHQALQIAFRDFDKAIKGYGTNLGQAIGIESRTSSPVKIPRNEITLMHPQIRGLFPCGEGGGYAGGIVSAAIDGERCAEAVIQYLS